MTINTHQMPKMAAFFILCGFLCFGCRESSETDSEVSQSKDSGDSDTQPEGVSLDTSSVSDTVGHLSTDSGDSDSIIESGVLEVTCKEMKLLGHDKFQNGFPVTRKTEDKAGIISCSNRSLHRKTAVSCTHPLYGAPINESDILGPNDGTCDWYQNLCTQVGETVQLDEGRYPTPECGIDDDCGSGKACVCAMTTDGEPNAEFSFTHCLDAECRTDADCPGTRCRINKDNCDRWIGFVCGTPEDECSGPADCIDNPTVSPPYQCLFVENEARWKCFERSDCE